MAQLFSKRARVKSRKHELDICCSFLCPLILSLFISLSLFVVPRFNIMLPFPRKGEGNTSKSGFHTESSSTIPFLGIVV